MGSNPIWDLDFFRLYVIPTIYLISCCNFSVSIFTDCTILSQDCYESDITYSMILPILRVCNNDNNNCGIYVALYPRAQSALQHFVGDFARLLI